MVTAGEATKFGINIDKANDVIRIAEKYNLKIAGLNQHIGSFIMTSTEYIKSVKELLQLSSLFEDIEFLDFGGGFGIPYNKQQGQQPLDLKQFGKELKDVLTSWQKEKKKNILFKCEPGRFVVAESSILLGKVYAKKHNYNKIYIGTDIGFSVLIRHAMYGAHHDIEIYRNDKPGAYKLEHLSFQALVAGEVIRSVARVIINGREKVREGVLIHMLDEIAFSALPADLVDRVEVDVSHMKPGDVLTVEELDIAKNEKIELITPLDSVVVTVTIPKVYTEEEEAETTDVAEPALVSDKEEE